jgi:hypothetical protein
MSDDPHRRFLAWLLDGPRGDPPRDLAVHAALCPVCMDWVSARDALYRIDVGRAPLPPGRSAATRRAAMLRQVGRFVAATASMLIVAGAVILGASQILAGRSGTNPEKTGGVLAASGSPELPASSAAATTSPVSPSASASATPTPTPAPTPALTLSQATTFPIVLATPPPPASIGAGSRTPTSSPPPRATAKPSPPPTPPPSPTATPTPVATPTATQAPSPS